MALTNVARFTLVVGWIILSSLQYGFHISALNSSQQSIVCGAAIPERGYFGLPTCLEISDFWFGVVTASYTLGGFVSSLLTGKLADTRGRKSTALYSAYLNVLGGCAMTFGTNLPILIVGRVLVGMACGIATVLVPLYLSEVSPPAIRGKIGVLTQLSICGGILLAQSISMPLSAPRTGKWRVILLVSVGVAVLQIITSPFMVESSLKRGTRRAYDVPDEERTPLADELDEDGNPVPAKASNEPSLSLLQVFTSRDSAVKHSLWTLVLSQLFQQCSGINTVMYYSTGILMAVNPANAKVVALFVTVVNFVMTLPAVYLVERLGRRALLVISLTSMSASSIVLAYSINHSMFVVASTCIILFVATFSIGLGPIPFVLMGELPPPKARSAVGSAALGVNWLSNFAIGLCFLPLRDLLSGGREDGSGTIFYIFAGISAVGSFWACMLKRLPA